MNDVDDKYDWEEDCQQYSHWNLFLAESKFIFFDADGDCPADTLRQASECEINYMIEDRVGKMGANLIDMKMAGDNAKELKRHKFGVGVWLMMNYFFHKSDYIVGWFEIPFYPGWFCWFFKDDVEVDGECTETVGYIFCPGNS